MSDEVLKLQKQTEGEPGTVPEAEQGLLLENQAYMEIMERLIVALISNNGLQHLVDEASAALDNPILVIDSGFRYIAHSAGTKDHSSSCVEIFREEMEHGCILEPGVQYIRKEKLDQITSGRNTPYYLYNKLLQCGFYISSVRIHNIEVAHLAMMAQNHSFTDLDYRCFIKLVGLVSQEMQKNPFYHENKGRLFSYLLCDLLESEHPHEQSILRRLEVLKYRLGTEFQIAVILGRQEADASKYLELLLQQLLPALSGHIYALYQNTLVILFNWKQQDDHADKAFEALESCAQRSGGSIGLSHSFNKITEVRCYYLQALRAAQLGSQHHGKAGFFPYQNYIWEDILELCRGSRNLIEFCHPGILRLLEYDRQNSSQLLLTLYTYLESPFNSQRVSNKLYIHKNTMFYRLDKIRSILGTSLRSGAELCQLYFSFRILQYMELFVPPAASEEDTENRAE